MAIEQVGTFVVSTLRLSFRGPVRVRLDKTQIEHNESAYPPTAALKRTSLEVGSVPEADVALRLTNLVFFTTIGVFRGAMIFPSQVCCEQFLR
jgi:hypothetical protein